jgi:hypothetical protein
MIIEALYVLIFVFIVILVYAVPIAIILFAFYYVIKKAVKNAILEAKIEQAKLDQIESSLMDSGCSDYVDCIESEQSKSESADSEQKREE